MDKLVNAIQSLSTNESDLRTLRQTLNKEDSTILKNLNSIEDVLSILDPTNHSLGYAYLLAAKAASPKVDPLKFMNFAFRFLLTCSAQIRLCPSKVVIISRKFKSIIIENGAYIKAIKPLRNAIIRLRYRVECLTPLHADFVQLCLLAKCYSAAVPLLDQDVLEVTPEQTGVTPRDFLLYYYYGGLVYTGLKNFGRAFEFFRTVITTPAAVMSAIISEAYKKYILLSLLVHGKVVSLPKYTSSVVQRFQKNAFPPYQEFATSFSTQSTDDLHKCAEVHAELFKKDKNFGLVKQCIQSLYKRNIQRFTQTYLTFSLKDISTNAKLPTPAEAERQVVLMIQNNEIFATINQKDGMVAFLENPEAYDTTDTSKSLDSKIQHTISLGKKVKEVEESIASSTTYLQRTTVHERGRWSEFGEDFEGLVPGKLV